MYTWIKHSEKGFFGISMYRYMEERRWLSSVILLILSHVTTLKLSLSCPEALPLKALMFGFNILLAISPCNFNFFSLKPFTSLLLVWFQLKSPIWVPSYSPACSGFFTLWPCSVPPVVYPLDSYFVFSSNGSCFFDFCSLSLL